MKRRNAVLFGVFAPLGAARSQTGGRVARVGLPNGGSAGAGTTAFCAPPLLPRFAELGHAAGGTLEIEYRFAEGKLDRILRGAKPGELPFEQATRFELVVNQKTAKALGLTLRPQLLLRANLVIE